MHRVAALVLLAPFLQPPAAAAQPVAPIAGASAAPLAQQAAPAVRTGNSFRYRQTLEQRFVDANVTRDGKLTQPQAFAARWSYVTRNFDAIDAAHSGTVTIEQIREFAAERRAARVRQDQQAPSQPTVRTLPPGS